MVLGGVFGNSGHPLGGGIAIVVRLVGDRIPRAVDFPGIGGRHLSVAGVFGIALATGLWWIHFDNVDGFVVRRRAEDRAWRPTVWIYSHLPLVLGIAMVGIGVEHVITAADAGHEYHTEDRWVLIAGAMIALAAMVLIEIASNRKSGEQVRVRIIWNRLIAIPLVFVVGLLALGPAITLILVASIIAVEVAVDILAATVAVDEEETVDS